MFDSALKPFPQFPGLAEAAFEALSVLNEVVQEGVAAGAIRRDDVKATVMAAWALMHGHATLIIDEQLAGPSR